MNIDLFGHPFVEPMPSQQIPLFHQPVAIAPIQSAEDKHLSRIFPAEGTPIMPNITPIRDRVRELIKRQNTPFVDVDSAERALFGQAGLRAFHFVAYAPAGDNWLIFCGQPGKAGREDMREWQDVFGDGFKSVIALDTTGGIQFSSLGGESLSLDELKGGAK